MRWRQIPLFYWIIKENPISVCIGDITIAAVTLLNKHESRSLFTGKNLSVNQINKYNQLLVSSYYIRKSNFWSDIYLCGYHYIYNDNKLRCITIFFSWNNCNNAFQNTIFNQPIFLGHFKTDMIIVNLFLV